MAPVTPAPLPPVRIHRCRLPVPPPPPEPEPAIPARSVIALGLPLLCVLAALLVPALHG